MISAYRPRSQPAGASAPQGGETAARPALAEIGEPAPHARAIGRVAACAYWPPHSRHSSSSNRQAFASPLGLQERPHMRP
jgi:hypothetical protein